MSDITFYIERLKIIEMLCWLLKKLLFSFDLDEILKKDYFHGQINNSIIFSRLCIVYLTLEDDKDIISFHRAQETKLVCLIWLLGNRFFNNHYSNVLWKVFLNFYLR